MNFNTNTSLLKNLTIRQLSLFITVVVVLINFIVLFVIFRRHASISDIPVLFVSILVGGLILYLFIRVLLERYVFRKIKLIYKIIHDYKLKGVEKADLDIKTTSLDQVNQEVIEWAEHTEKEIKMLKTLEKYRKDFVGNISHELKTPIFSLQGYLHTLLDGGIHDESINIKYIKRAAKNAERLQRIVEDLEEISKLESGKLILDIRKFDIKALVQEVFLDLEVHAQEKNITLQFKEGAAKSFNVLADREVIRQVLNNLIINSIKYGKEGGHTKISFYDMDKNILIEVSDDGIGINEEHLKHLFDRFYRVDTSRSRSQGGSGLGLSIVKHIVEAHNQTINVRSREGVGSTFGFTLKKAVN